MNSYNAHITQNTENSIETTKAVGRPFPKGMRGKMSAEPTG